jgi:hypothetical protein
MQQLAYKNEANLNTFATNVGDFLKKSMLRWFFSTRMAFVSLPKFLSSFHMYILHKV